MWDKIGVKRLGIRHSHREIMDKYGAYETRISGKETSILLL